MWNEEKIVYAVWEKDLVNNLDKLGLQGFLVRTTLRRIISMI